MLTSVTHSNGSTLRFTIDALNRVIGMQDPSGGQYSYNYDRPTDNLVSVTYPDQSTRTYLYNEPSNVPASFSLPHTLTGIIDENNNRFATYQYDAQGRAISTQHAGGADFVGVTFGTDSNVVTDALGTSRAVNLQTVQGVVKSSGSSQPPGSGCPAASSAMTYDANGNVALPHRLQRPQGLLRLRHNP